MAQARQTQAGGAWREDRASRAPQADSRLFWTVLVLAAMIALGFGAYGWWLQDDAGKDPASLVEIGVRSVHALFLSDIYFDESIKPEAEPWLAVARTAGAVFTVLAAGRILLFAVGARFTELMLRGRRGHDVVIGEGAAAHDYALLAGARKVTHLVREQTTTGGKIARLKRHGPLGAQLARAGAQKASRILVDENDDADTWETAQRAARACPGVDVLAHIRDTWVLERLSRADPETSLRPFSYAGGVARQIMLAHPPYLLARAMAAQKQHIVLIGFGSVGQALLREFLITSVSRGPSEMMVTAIDPRMEQLASDFLARHPGLGAQVDIQLLSGDVRQDAGTVLQALAQRRTMSEICAVYVSIDDAHLPLSAGLAIKDRASRLDLFRAPIFLCADHGAGLAQVRQGIGVIGAPSADAKQASEREKLAQVESLLCELRLVSFGSWSDAFDGAGLWEPQLDGQARRLHETYEKLVQAAKPGDGSSANPWSGLSDEFRASNRRAAAHIRAKADAAGFDLNGWLAEPAGGRRVHELPPARDVFLLNNAGFMEQMGELEHRRWMIDRLLNGWKYGAVRDNRARLHPDLRPFNELDPNTKGKDDNVIATTAELIETATGRRKR
jgi:voltage-gated potassium channel Kch